MNWARHRQDPGGGQARYETMDCGKCGQDPRTGKYYQMKAKALLPPELALGVPAAGAARRNGPLPTPTNFWSISDDTDFLVVMADDSYSMHTCDGIFYEFFRKCRGAMCGDAVWMGRGRIGSMGSPGPRDLKHSRCDGERTQGRGSNYDLKEKVKKIQNMFGMGAVSARPPCICSPTTFCHFQIQGRRAGEGSVFARPSRTHSEFF